MARCFKCNKKLKMAEELVGKCKCNNTFCSKHRISSQHSFLISKIIIKNY